MVWVVFALMTVAAVLSVLWPLGRARRRQMRAQVDMAFYRMQLAEVERDAARELIAPGEIAGARTEVARRLLAASDEADGAAGEDGASARPRRLAAAAFTLILIPLVSLGLYARLGSPDQPDEPLQARLNAPPAEMELAVAVARIEAHLAAHPDDGHGYEIIAPVYLRMGRADDAVKAFGKALALLGETPERREAYGEALIAAANGQVTAEARKAFEAVLAVAPSRPKSRYYMALATEQAGDKPRAIELLSKLAADAPPDAPWVAAVRARIADLGGTAPPPNEAAAIAALPPADQQAAIRGMVDGLAARLAQDGHDPEGWLRLVRAYVVLNEGNKARDALADARRSLAADPAALTRLEALGHELGLGGS